MPGADVIEARVRNGLIDLAGHGDSGGGKDAGLAMLRRRARRGDPEAALHILDHIVPDVPPQDGGEA